MFVAFIEARPDRPEDHPEPPREPWVLGALSWLLPWPALIVWLCVASRVLDGWAAVGCIDLAVGLAAWRCLRALPSDGLRHDRQ